MPDHTSLRTAEFSQQVKPYFLLRSVLICAASIFLIPIIPIVLLVGAFFIQKYLDNLSCVLTERTLEMKRGILNKTESTIPLEKITDLQMFQGPVMRHFGLHGFKVETAGQTANAGTLLSIIGIVGAPDFRQAVLAQRDALHDGASTAAPAVAHATPAAGEITEIRDAVLRIEKLLEQRSD